VAVLYHIKAKLDSSAGAIRFPAQAKVSSFPVNDSTSFTRFFSVGLGVHAEGSVVLGAYPEETYLIDQSSTCGSWCSLKSEGIIIRVEKVITSEQLQCLGIKPPEKKAIYSRATFSE
jgi:hypothetical protein